MEREREKKERKREEKKKGEMRKGSLTGVYICIYFRENSARFLVIYSCTVRGIVYLNIDKAYSLSLSLFPSRCAKSCGAKFTEERDIIRPEVHVRGQCSQPQNVSRPFETFRAQVRNNSLQLR